MLQLIDVARASIERKMTGSTIWAAELLFISIVVSAVIAFLRSGAPRTPLGLLHFMFPKTILTHPSARADFAFWITRKVVMLFLAVPTGLSVTAACGYATHAFLLGLLGPISVQQDPSKVALIAFTVSMLLAYDISYYWYHTLQHRVPILWELHKVHHSAEVMVGTTKDRVHPFDEIMNRVWDGVITGPVYGLWSVFLLSPIELTVLGINVYVLRNIIMMDFVRHTHLKVSFGRVMNAIILCPHYHQLHHSVNPIHYDKNFGLMLSVWDRMFGTLAAPQPGESFAFGLPNREHEQYRSLKGLYLLPLRKMARQLVSYRRRPRHLPLQSNAGPPGGKRSPDHAH